MKTCPYCFEMLPDTAIKCKYCKRILNLQKTPNRFFQHDEGAYPPWNINEAFAVFASLFIGQFILSILLAPVKLILLETMKTYPSEAVQQIFSVLFSLILKLLMFGIVYYIITLYHKLDFKDGIKLTKLNNFILFLIIPITLLLYFLNRFLSQFTPENVTTPIEQMVSTLPAAIIFGFLAISIDPIIEEIVFRGYFYPALSRKLGVYIAIFITTAIFTLLHIGQLFGNWIAVFNVFIIGLILTVLRAYTKSTTPSILVHLCYNNLIFIFGLLRFISAPK